MRVPVKIIHSAEPNGLKCEFCGGIMARSDSKLHTNIHYCPKCDIYSEATASFGVVLRTFKKEPRTVFGQGGSSDQVRS